MSGSWASSASRIERLRISYSPSPPRPTGTTSGGPNCVHRSCPQGLLFHVKPRSRRAAPMWITMGSSQGEPGLDPRRLHRRDVADGNASLRARRTQLHRAGNIRADITTLASGNRARRRDRRPGPGPGHQPLSRRQTRQCPGGRSVGPLRLHRARTRSALPDARDGAAPIRHAAVSPSPVRVGTAPRGG